MSDVVWRSAAQTFSNSRNPVNFKKIRDFLRKDAGLRGLVLEK